LSLTSFSLTDSGTFAGPIELQEETILSVSISGSTAFVAERSLDNGATWVASADTFTANTVRNIQGHGLFRIRITTGGALTVQYLR
jgi:hypothetical protein